MRSPDRADTATERSIRKLASAFFLVSATFCFNDCASEERVLQPVIESAQTGASSISSSTQSSEFKNWVVQVIVNGRRFGTQMALERGDRWWLPELGTQAWGVTAKSNLTNKKYRGITFVPVDEFGLNKTDFDELALVLNITFDASAFPGGGIQRLSGSGDFVQPTRQVYGGFVNYDLLLTTVSERGARNATELGAAFELGAFGPIGSISNSFKVAKRTTVTTENSPPSVVREYSTYRVDWPQNFLTLEVGDTTGKAGIWGRPVLFGGVNFRTNFLLRPGYITYPQPAFSGAAVVPSTATVLIDNVRRANLTLTPGPFGVSNVPVLSGNNEVTLVVRDSLGRETVTRQQFYASLDLLKPGLHDFSLEGGLARQNFGLRSFDYHPILVVGQSRYGWNERLTTEVRLEQAGRATTFGIGAISLVPIPAIATVAVAASQRNGQFGQLIAAGLEKRDRAWSAGVRGQWTSASFTQLGGDQIGANAKQNLTAYASVRLGAYGEYGGIGMAYADAGRDPATGGKTITATWTKSLPRNATFHLTALYSNQPKASTQLSAFLNYPLGPRLSVSTDVSRSSSGAAATSLSAATSLNNVEEMGWKARISTNTAPNAPANTAGGVTVMWRAPGFDTSAGVGVSGGAQAGRIAVSGAVGVADGVWFNSRTLHNGIGVIRTPGMVGIPIVASGRVVAVSNGVGVAVVPNLVPYEQNTFRVDLKRLPLNIETDEDTIVLVPAYRSAAVGEIKLFRAVSAMMIVTDVKGAPISLGSDVNLVGSSERFVVGGGGRLYLSRLQQRNEIVISLDSGDCKFFLDIPEQHFSPLADGNRRLQLGSHICR